MNAPAPLAYSLCRDTGSHTDGRGNFGESWFVHVQGLPLRHELDGTTELPADIVSGSEAHAYVQARLPGARYMSPDQRRARKYRGAYPAKIRELFHAGALYVVTCNSGARYSIPAGAGLPVPAIGHCVRAFERTDWTGATHPAETDTTGATLTASEVEALEAAYLDTRRDLPCPVEAAARVAGKAFVTSPRYNVFNVRDGAGATVATRATLYGPDGAQVMAETMNRRAAERASSEAERLERMESNRAARVSLDKPELPARAAMTVEDFPPAVARVDVTRPAALEVGPSLVAKCGAGERDFPPTILEVLEVLEAFDFSPYPGLYDSIPWKALEAAANA